MMRVCHLNTCPVGIATPGPRAAQALPRHPRAGHRVPDAGGRGGARDHGLARDPPRRGDDRAHRAARHGRRDRPLEGPARRSLDGARDRPSCRRGRRATGPGRRCRCSTTRSTGSWCAAARRRSSTASGVQARADPGPQRQPHGRRDPVRRDRAAPRSQGAARGDDRDLVLRLGRAELRGVARAGRDVLAARRDQRLRRQGAVRRDRLGPPAGACAVPRRGEHDRRQHRPVRGDRRAGVLPRARRRALRGAQLGRQGGRRGRRRSRLRVHDRRARGRARDAPGGTSRPG